MAAPDRDAITRAGNRIVGMLEAVLAIALIAGILLDFGNVVGRYTGAFSLLGVDELEIYILIWIAFLGAVAVTWHGQHLRMDVLVQSLPRPLKQVVVAAEIAIAFLVMAFVALQSFQYVGKLFALGSVSDILGIPTWIPHSAVSISLTCMALIVLFQGILRHFSHAEVAQR